LENKYTKFTFFDIDDYKHTLDINEWNKENLKLIKEKSISGYHYYRFLYEREDGNTVLVLKKDNIIIKRIALNEYAKNEISKLLLTSDMENFTKFYAAFKSTETKTDSYNGPMVYIITQSAGIDLAKFLQLVNFSKNRRLIPTSFIDLFIRDVLTGLVKINARGYSHLDLKPSNIMLSNSGYVNDNASYFQSYFRIIDLATVKNKCSFTGTLAYRDPIVNKLSDSTISIFTNTTVSF